MPRAFKIEFHNGFPDEKPIVVMSVRVAHGGRFNKLDREGKEALIAQLSAFQKSVMQFSKEIEASIYTNKQ
jgi:hypothetical protein